MQYALGIDIGGTNTKIGLVTSDGQLISSDFIKTQSKDEFTVFVERVHKKCHELLEENSEVELNGIGIGAPNANSKTGRIEHPPNLNWEIAEVLVEFGKKFHLPIQLQNDANVAASGERRWGKGQGVDDLIVVTLGTGLGTGIYSSGQLITSYNGMAAEGGHIAIERNGRPCGCGGRGHLESYVSVKGIKKTVQEITGNELKFAEICELYQNQDANITKAVEITADHLAYGLAQMFILFLPKKFVLAGGVSNLGQEFCSLTQEKFKSYAYPAFAEQCSIELSDISLKNGAILGAASLLF